MSVAFRRESDDEHLEPKFELPLPAGRNLVTPRGLALIEARVAELEAAGPGAARDLRYWRTRLATAEVQPAFAGDEAGFGATVTWTEDGRESRATLVGHDEADPAAGLLAFSAPLARALTGAAAGDRVQFGARTLEVVDVG